jgi:acetyl-CoA acetyltransferase
MGARLHMERYGTTQRQLAVISAKNHYHGSLNPLAQYQKDMSVEEVLADKVVAYPLTRPMCAPIGDGAAAALLCSGSRLKRYPDARPVRIRASVLAAGALPDYGLEPIGTRLSRKAYEQAGLGPEDIDVAEVHDATAFGELLQCEELGFCPEGEGGILAESGDTTLGGKLPINTSGGLECRGHPIGASGLAQIHELVTQLRGEAGARQVEGARIALSENGGGFIGMEEAAMCVHILEGV